MARRTKKQWRMIQRGMNNFTDKYLLNVARLRVDGVPGRNTRNRVRRVKYYLGWNKRTNIPGEKFRHQLRHPRWAQFTNPRRARRGYLRRREQRRLMQDMLHRARGGGLVMFDGKPGVEWIVHRLKWARDRGWRGWAVSLYRTPEYSEHLCITICGRTSCPGLCAGRSSNHTQKGFPHGAADVSYYDDFGNYMRQYDREHPNEPNLYNNLPRDRVHYSSTGN